MTPEEHDRIVKAGLSKFSFAKQEKKDEINDLIDKAQQITTTMRDSIRPILRAGGWKDKPALRAMVMTMYIEAFDKVFGKDELVNLCAILHTEIAMERIEANPYDNDVPDALGGA